MQINKAQFVCSSERLSQLPKDSLPEFAFIGRSNVGKSSMVNMLTGRSGLAKVSGTPGKTRLINHFRINDSWYLVDLPGYGYAKASPQMRASWTSLVGGYIAERPSLVGVVIVMDARRPFMPADEWLIHFFSDKTHVRQLWLINKCDQISRAERAKVLAAAQKRARETGPHIFVQLFSGLKKEGVEPLQETLLSWIDPEGRLA